MSCLHRSLRSCHPSMRGRRINRESINQNACGEFVCDSNYPKGQRFAARLGAARGVGWLLAPARVALRGCCYVCFVPAFCKRGCLFVFGGGLRGGWSLSRQRPRDLRYKSENKGLTSADRRTSLLSCLQYPVLTKSSTMDLSSPVPERRLNVVLGRSLSLRVNTGDGYIVAFQHGF